MCEAAMPQISNHNLILNEECTSQDNQEKILSRFGRKATKGTANNKNADNINNGSSNDNNSNNRDVEEDDEVVDDDDDEVVDDEYEHQAHRSNSEGAESSKSLSASASAETLSNQEITGLKQNIIHLQHQITLLMNALHVPTCKCEVCKPICQNQASLFSKLKDNCLNLTESRLQAKSESPKAVLDKKSTVPAVNDMKNYNTLSAALPPIPPETAAAVAATAAAAVVQASNAAAGCGAFGTGTPTAKECEAWLQQVFSQSGMGSLAQANLSGLAGALGLNFTPQKPFANVQSTNTYSTPNPGGRKSKYCSPAEKKAVADYANIHGASAAARKFNIPPPVAAYYHRKEYKKRILNCRQLNPTNLEVSATLLSQIQHSAVHIDSSSTTSGDDAESNNTDWIHNGQVLASGVAQNNAATNGHHLNGVADLFKADQQKTNPAHSTGSPGFLRGRGRGRPKLIGDELDAELVDYMVQLKQSDPRGHLTASQALAIARDYIMEKAPGLLEEHGGQIKLKLTWAMKLVTRISERQKEIELGLPPGGNAGATSPGGNYMAEMVAQNILNQQVTQIIGQAMTGAASATPEILNVRELELPKHSENDTSKGEVIGEIDFKQNNSSFKSDANFEEEMDTQTNDEAMETENHSHSNEPLQQHFISTNAF
uniref:Homeobox protein prospero n=1 Tax=Syphacia muris TaxID=451379 RepID=A0A0N5AYK4_9BILA